MHILLAYFTSTTIKLPQTLEINYDVDLLIDSGASCHFTFNVDMLVDIRELKNGCFVKMPNGESLKVQFRGTCYLNSELILCNVLFVPEFKVSLISISKLVMDNDCSVQFNKIGCIVQDHDCTILLKTSKPYDGLFQY